MIETFKEFNPVLQAFLAGCFTWGLTALGASAVFFFKSLNRKVMDAMLGFTAGVMIAASYWSLLAPAIEMSENSILPKWLPPAIGFLLGGATLYFMDKILPHLHIPLQSGSDDILKLMKRRYNTKLYESKIEKIKNMIPDCCIGVDVIVGFPSETEEDFLKASNYFYRISQVVKTDWLSSYYYAYSNTNLSMMQDDADLKEEYLDKALNILAPFDTLKTADLDSLAMSEIYTLRAMIYVGKIFINPMINGMKYGPISDENIEKAKILLGATYFSVGEYDMAMDIYLSLIHI